MKRKDFSGPPALLEDILPPEFDTDFIQSFFESRGERQNGSRDTAEARRPLELADYAVETPEDPVEETVDGETPDVADTGEDEGTDTHPLTPDLPEQAKAALDALLKADEKATADLSEVSAVLRHFAPDMDEEQDHTHDDGHSDHGLEHEHEHDHEQVIDDTIVDAAAKPTWAGGNKDGGNTDGGKGKGKNKDTADTGGDTGTGSTTDSGTNTGTTTDTGTETGTDTGTHTGSTETNTGSDAPNVYVSGLDTPDGFNIELVFEGDWSEARMGFIASAAEKISDIITDDIPNHNGIDDIQITVRQASIDGGGGTWATGGPRSVRSDTYLPSTGVVTFDTDDLGRLDSNGLWEDLGLHEIMHALGFGTLFSANGLVETINGQVRFTGANAIEAYNAEFAGIASNDPLSDQGIQLDPSGAHWHDGTFTKELMTPYLRLSGNYLSDMSIAAMEDIGYNTIYGDNVAIA